MLMLVRALNIVAWLTAAGIARADPPLLDVVAV